MNTQPCEAMVAFQDDGTSEFGWSLTNCAPTQILVALDAIAAGRTIERAKEVGGGNGVVLQFARVGGPLSRVLALNVTADQEAAALHILRTFAEMLLRQAIQQKAAIAQSQTPRLVVPAIRRH